MEFSLAQVSLAEAISIECEQVIGQNLQFASHLALFHFEGHFIDNLAKFFIQSVIFDHKEILCKLFHDFAKSKFIDLTIGNKPANLLPNLLKHSLPVDHLLEFILDLILLLNLDFLLFDAL